MRFSKPVVGNNFHHGEGGSGITGPDYGDKATPILPLSGQQTEQIGNMPYSKTGEPFRAFFTDSVEHDDRLAQFSQEHLPLNLYRKGLQDVV